MIPSKVYCEVNIYLIIEQFKNIQYSFCRVLYISIHRYEEGKFWPNLRESQYDKVGEAAGKGFNINIPLNATGLGDTEYLAIFHNIILPVAYEVTHKLRTSF